MSVHQFTTQRKLIGNIRFHCDLSSSSSSTNDGACSHPEPAGAPTTATTNHSNQPPSKSKKQKLSKPLADLDEQHTLVLWTKATSSKELNHFKDQKQHAPEIRCPLVGWIFEKINDPSVTSDSRNDARSCHTDKTPYHTDKTLYLLSVPQCYQQLVCNACQYQRLVEITHFTIVALPNGFRFGSKSKPDGTNVATTLFPMAVICVPQQDDALTLLNAGIRPSITVDHVTGEPGSDSIWTCEQLATYERLHPVENNNGHGTTISKRHQKYNLRGKVAYISPLLSVTSNDPFVLMELVNEHEIVYRTTDTATNTSNVEFVASFRCVIVMRNDGLKCWTAIVPNDIVTFRNLRKQQWRVPDLLLRQQQNHHGNGVYPNTGNATTITTEIPSKSVFVMDSANQIHCLPHPPRQCHTSACPWQPMLSTSAVDTTTTTTTVAAATIEGRIQCTHFMKYKNRSGHDSRSTIHCLEIVTSTNHIVTLFVSYFPMSTTTQLLLLLLHHATDAIKIYIRASNVQNLGYHGYAANLYSHVSIIDCSVDVTVSSSMATTNDTVSQLLLPIPFDLMKLQRSYHQLWLRRLVMTSILPDLRTSWFTQHSMAVPSLDDICDDVLLRFGMSSKQHDGTTTVTKRNVYAEFFTRPNELLHMNNDAETYSSDDSKFFSDFDMIPFPISIRRIQETSFEFMSKRLKSYMEQNPENMKTGWTGSIQLIGPSLQKVWDPEFAGHSDRRSRASPALYTFGLSTVSTRNGMKFSVMSDGCVILPVVFAENVMVSPLVIDDAASKFAWIRVQCVTITCICIGSVASSTTTSESRENATSTSLPPYHNDNIMVQATACGSCGVCVVNEHIFVVSVYLVGDRYQPIPTPALSENNPENIISVDSSSTISLEQCLNPILRSDDETTTSSVVGLFTRGIYRQGKVKSGEYSSYTMVLAYVPVNSLDRCSPIEISSTVQSVEVKPSIKVCDAKRNDLRCAISNLIGDITMITEERFTLGTIWWKLASCPWTCALLGGGWDDFFPDTCPSNKALGAVVYLPSTSVHRDSNRGYTRFRCKMENIVVSVRWMLTPESEKAIDRHHVVDRVFDYIGSDKFATGKLDRRPRRRKFGDLAYGELLTRPYPCKTNNSLSSGIPRSRLSDLTVLLCLDLQSTTERYHLAPSLTREVQRANFLGISYCRARVECSQCYATLYNPQSRGEDSSNNPKRSHDANYIVESVAMSTKYQSCDTPLYDRSTAVLLCPNGCRVDAHGAVKWECSGVLDDGTGQAKLYAEREAALCLLGIPCSTLQRIEQTLWHTGNTEGFVYMKKAPIPSYLSSAILTARSCAIQHIKQCGKDYRLMNEADVIQFLTKPIYGEYLFYQHCRTSLEPLRDLIYYVRCKPLSDTTNSLNQAEITVVNDERHSSYSSDFVTTSVAPTYTLPPLNLNLVDCCSANG